MKTKIIFILLSLFIYGTQIATATVCLENGIYISDQLDLSEFGEESDIFSLTLERTYNSSSSSPGMFGLGWGTVYTTTLIKTDNDVLVIQAGNTGQKSFYTPGNNEVVDSEDEYEIAQLHNNCSFLDETKHQGSRGGKKQIATEELYKWRLGCIQGYVKKDAAGYQRILAGMTEFFDANGKLYKVTNDQGVTIVIHRNDQEQIDKISDNKSHSLSFEYSLDGFVTSAAQGDKKVSYQYQGENLTLAVAGEDKHQYSYNEEKKLAQITFNGTVIENISYDIRGRVTFIESENDRLTVLQYLDSTSMLLKEGFSHGVIRTIYRDKQRTMESINFYAREINRYGISYLGHHLEENIYGRHETVFQQCGLPEVYSSSSERYKTRYHYNENCQLVLQNNGRKIQQYNYDEKHQKISKVTTTDIKSNQITWSSFTYNAKGKLILGKTSDNLETHLVYGSDNQIASMRDESGQVVSFQYNDAGKPTRIEVADVGRMDITYDDQGEISSVDTAEGAGHEVAISLTRIFQKLLNIVKPAGIELNM